MAENITLSDDSSSWNPAMRPDGSEVPVATADARDLGTTSENDTTEPLIPPPVSDTPADKIASPEDGALMETNPFGDVHEQTVPNNELDSNRAVDAQVAPELNPSPEGSRPDETTTSTADGDNDETPQPVAEALANENGQAFFDQLDQQNGAKHDPFGDPVPAEPPAGSAVQEQTQLSEVQDSATGVEDHANGQQSFATDGESGNADSPFWDNIEDDNGDEDDDFFDQLKTQTKPIYMPPEPESRYEEGVPLLNEAPQTPVEPTATAQPELTTTANAEPTTAKAEAQIDNIFAADGDEGGDDFFSQVQQSEPKPEVASHITRKSTPQVMESAGEPLDSPVGEASPHVQQFNEMLAAPNQVKKASSEEDLAARWQAELSDTEEPLEDDLAARWQAELDDDDDLLMDDLEGEATTTGQEQVNQNVPGTTGYTAPSGFNRPQASRASSSYIPHQPSTSDLLHGVRPPAAAQPIPPPASSYFPPQAPPRPETVRAESFTVRSKEGYKSPYDVPENMARPRRPAKPVITAAGPVPPTSTPPIESMPPPPPRSSSIPAAPPAAAPVPPPPIGASSQMGSPPPPAAASLLAPSKSFYEELPLPPARSRSRPASSGRYAPNPNATTTAPAGVSQPLPAPPNPYSSIAPNPQLPSEAPEQPQLHPPERLDPYVNSLVPPSASSRYSPRPGGLQPGTKSPSAPRYSPAPPPSSAGSSPRTNRYVAQQPPSAPGPPGLALPFQPRTSSPLAYHEKASYQPDQPETRPSLQPAASLSPPNRFQPRPSLDQGSPRMPVPAVDGVDPAVANVDAQKGMPLLENQQQTPPSRNIYAPPSYVNGFAKSPPPSNGAPTVPVIGMPEAGESQFVTPRRSQTQSPSQQMAGPKLSIPSIDPLQRPASVHGSGSPTKSTSSYAPAQVSARSRAASMHLNFVPPTDEQQTDPLERWKGAPIVTFGFGGSITSCFPKHIPRYSAGQAAPMVKSCPGEVKICQLNEWLPPAEGIVAHPGPLKNKSKKKDVLNWLSIKIAAFENEGLPQGVELYADSQKRHEEKILLWKIVKVLVEKDGVLEGSAEVQKALRDVIFPHLQNADADQTTYGNGISQPLNATAQPDAVDSRSLDILRDNLVLGEREKAVWGAVDNRLWGHAMIIASTLDKSLWKQVVQEFVRREVRSATSNTESLAALYEIFAGNVEESVDELVPPSARVGLQMVSTVNGQESSKNALDGLDSWKDTLGMVLSNRSPEDYQALLALGRLLLSYGRVEAAHICIIFSRAALFGGADDPQASIVLLGANHQYFPSTFMHDEDSILLTEVYEFATSILANLPQATLPHLTGFKLQYAWTLADRGRKSEAQQYCDAITAALKASTRPSGYYHRHLFSTLDELSARLRQTTADGGSSWISKPSMEKVSGSMWAKFNSFVSGEDSDAASTGSGKNADADVGPFAKVAGTPTVSRSPSVSDLYGSYPGPGPQPIPAHGASRYHPSSSQYVPNASPEQFRGRSSIDSQRSFGLSFGRRGSQEPATPNDNNSYFPSGSLYNSPLAGYQSTPPQTSYMPLAPVEEDLPSQPEAPSAPMQASSISGSPYQPSMYTPDMYAQPFGDQSASNQAQPTFGYMPAGVDSYGPPIDEISGASAPHEEGDVEEEKPKKSMMDEEDDEDIAARAISLQKAEKERQDREAEEAFKKAAEADGKLETDLMLNPSQLVNNSQPNGQLRRRSRLGSEVCLGRRRRNPTTMPVAARSARNWARRIPSIMTLS